MKTLTITYDVKEKDEDGASFVGETCMDITMMDMMADDLISKDEETLEVVEILLYRAEALKGRTYLKGSIKDIRE